jgi:hypothetical protein
MLNWLREMLSKLHGFSDVLSSSGNEHDPTFREALLKEGVECLLSGDVETGKTVLRDYINATIGFETLGDER